MEYMTLKELASFLRVHPNTVRNWLLRGLPHVRVGEGSYRFNRDDVLAWLKTASTSNRGS